MGFPPALLSKNEVLRFRSANNIVIAPARTGSLSKSRTLVINIAQMNKGSLNNSILACRLCQIVVIKLILLIMLEAPAMWSLKIAKSTLMPL